MITKKDMIVNCENKSDDNEIEADKWEARAQLEEEYRKEYREHKGLPCRGFEKDWPDLNFSNEFW